MAVTNAISSVIIVGALIAAGPAEFGFSELMGFLAVILASVHIFGGFIVTQRMLSMFKKKKSGARTIMTAALAALLYLVASVCFILALRVLSLPTPSRAAHLSGLVVMATAIPPILQTPCVVNYT